MHRLLPAEGKVYIRSVKKYVTVPSLYFLAYRCDMLTDSPFAQNALILSVIAVSLYIIYSRTQNATRLKARGLIFPAGPKGYPIIGNLFDIPQEHQWLTFASWKKTYG